MIFYDLMFLLSSEKDNVLKGIKCKKELSCHGHIYYCLEPDIIDLY